MNDDLGGWSLPTDHDVGKDPSFIAIGKGKSPPHPDPTRLRGTGKPSPCRNVHVDDLYIRCLP